MITYDLEVCTHNPSIWAFPCDDYYACTHCQLLLKGLTCDLDHTYIEPTYKKLQRQIHCLLLSRRYSFMLEVA